MNKVWILFTAIMLIIAGCKNKEASQKSSNAQERSKKKVLVGMAIQRVELTRFPPYAKDGSKWDAGPDVYVTMKQLGQPLWRSTVKEDCVAGMKLEFLDQLPFEIKAFTNEVLLEVFDEDGISSNDNMGYISFRPSDFKKENEIRLKNIDGELEVVLNVEWKYENR
jgi:hypothetical protein